MDPTEKKLAQMEKHVRRIYDDAQKDLRSKWDKYMERADRKTRPLWDELGKTTNEDERKVVAQRLNNAIRLQTLNNQHYKTMVDQVAANLTHVNEIASAYVNDQLPGIYSMNYNDLFKQSSILDTGVSFELMDPDTVKHLMTTDKSLLPTKRVDVPKDIAWNVKQLNLQVTQGIIQGESIGKISQRLQTVTDMNKASAVRNARTMCTEAQNKGRLDSFKQAEEEGMIIKKVWMATTDGRTRDWHAALDGEERDVDEAFETEYGPIMYPGDPHADPCNVYNCRCTLVTKILGFKKPAKG